MFLFALRESEHFAATSSFAAIVSLAWFRLNQLKEKHLHLQIDIDTNK